MQQSIAVIGAGIYGSTISNRLATRGYRITLFDPLGILCAASAISQYRIHRGYHYPRSPETIAEILEARDEFMNEYGPAVVKETENYYAIPFEGSRTKAGDFESLCSLYSLPLKRVFPHWIDFDFIERCYLVEEHLYDPDILRTLIMEKIKHAGVRFQKSRFTDSDKDRFDLVIYATYGTSGSHMHLFEKVQLQVAEKILITLPPELARKSIVVIDGPFTGFDPYGNSGYSLFGSARYTNHWTTLNPYEAIPQIYQGILNSVKFEPVSFTQFENMVHDASRAVPLAKNARYLGSRFTLRLIEYNPPKDRRILRVCRSDSKTIHVFSGKVVSAVKAAKLVEEMIN